MDSDDLRRAAVVAGVLGGLVSGATGDYGDAEESDSRVLPADWAFGIWFPVYAGSLAYAAETARPSRRRDPLLRRTGWPAAAAYALAGTWVRLRPRQQVPVVAATMAAAALAHTRAGAGPARPADRWTVRLPLGLFAGWLTLASVAAPTEVLLAEGVRPGPRAADAWGVAMTGAAAAIASAVARGIPSSRGYPAAVVWGLVAAAVRNAMAGRRVPAAAAALAAGAVTAAGSRPTAAR
ncbi:hypothetical protein [Geodermatophilus sp. SYSU D00710]